jgi:hypothetical protein
VDEREGAEITVSADFNSCCVRYSVTRHSFAYDAEKLRAVPGGDDC